MYSAPLNETSRLVFTRKGRVALYAILKAMGVGVGDEVVMPAFTCIVVPNTVLYLGAKPVYADIDHATYTPTAETIAPCLSRRTKVVLAQNTFGLSADLDPILRLARGRGIRVVEDCAHGLGGTYNGRPNGTVADASFFSTQWSKPISTGLGGVAYSADTELLERVRALVAKMPKPSRMQQLSLVAQQFVRPVANHPQFHYPLVAAYRLLSQRLGIISGSSRPGELDQTEMPAEFCMQMGRHQRVRLRRALRSFPDLAERRLAAAAKYDRAVERAGLKVPYRPAYARHAMLRYALRVGNRSEVLQHARRCAIPLGDWFKSPLHPFEGDPRPWHYQPGQCPVAERACAELINLFTDHALTSRQLDQLLAISRPVADQTRLAA